MNGWSATGTFEGEFPTSPAPTRARVPCVMRGRWSYPLRAAKTGIWLASTALALTGLTAVVQPAMAQDATWLLNPGSNDFNAAANWSPTTVPTQTDTAFFGVSNTTDRYFSKLGNTITGGWTFNAGASNYALHIGDQTVSFDGAGIVINGGSATLHKYGANGSLIFNNSSSAGSATINNDFGNLRFNNTSSAGSATTINNTVFGFNAGITNIPQFQLGRQRYDHQQRGHGIP